MRATAPPLSILAREQLPLMVDLDAVILCGGAGSRLGGGDKPLQPFLGRPLIHRVVANLRPQVGRIVISANRNAEAYGVYSATVLADEGYAGFGPLAGVAAGLAAGSSPWLLCVPGDAPLLPPDLATRLLHVQREQRTNIVYVDDGFGPQPLCCLLARSLLDDLRRYLDAGGRTPREWFAEHRVAAANFNAWPRWAWSLNTPDEWRLAEQHLSTDDNTP